MIPLLFALITVHIAPSAPDLAARQPQFATDGKTIGLTFGEANAIYFAASRDGGKSFTPRVKVADTPGLMLGRHRGPRLALSGNTVVVTAISGAKAGEGELRSWRSTDGGLHWSKAVVVNDVPFAAREGLQNLAAAPNGRLFIAWLDHRGEGMELWGAESADAGATWSANRKIYASPDGHICECCHPSVAFDSAGGLLVMWRNWLGGSRDLYLMRSADGVNFSAAQKLGTGTWPLNACPMDGGALSVTGSQVATAWRRGDALFFTVPGQPEVKMGDGKDVAMAWDGARTLAVWTSATGIQGWSAGKAEAISKLGSFPAITALSGGGFLVAWEENGGISLAQVPRN